MVIDGRRDHSLRVPRPDLAAKLNTPDACTQCHIDRKPDWASAALDRWLGKAWRERPNIGPALHAGATQGAMAVPGLLELARSSAQPYLVRATAAGMLVPHMRPSLLATARELLQDADAEIRIAALPMMEQADMQTRALAVSPLLSDPVRGVRIEAARVLAGIPEGALTNDRQEAYRRALNEYIETQRLDADWPIANINMGNLYLRLGRFDEAAASYRQALKLDPKSSTAWVNLADAWRAQGRNDEAEVTLRKGLSVLPESPDLLHALGLALVRKGDKAGALISLSEAARRAPDRPRYSYVWAIALHSAGRVAEAVQALRVADKRHPYDVAILRALVSIEREIGDTKSALVHAKKLSEVLPDDPRVKATVVELQRGG
jgi:tetratricopeptide (TPR) repeat protein